MSGRIGSIFHDANHPAGFSTPWKLWKASGENKETVDSYLQTQDAYTLHKPVRRKFKRNVVYSDNIDESWQMDLIDFKSLKCRNKGMAYILCVIDTFSKFGWAIPLKEKKGAAVVQAFKTLFRSTSRRPCRLFSDKGKEFLNQTFQTFLKENDITFTHTQNPDIKCSIAERWIRSLKTKIYKIFTATESQCYINGTLEKVVHSYNNTYHRSIKMKPSDVTPERVLEVYKNLYHNIPFSSQKAKYKKNDYVRISREKHILEKGYTQNWSQEIFQICQVIRHRMPVYRLRDLDSDPIEGTFYEAELQKVAKPDKFKIEYIVQTKGTGARKKHLVHWKGYPEKSDSWILDSDIVK